MGLECKELSRHAPTSPSSTRHAVLGVPSPGKGKEAKFLFGTGLSPAWGQGFAFESTSQRMGAPPRRRKRLREAGICPSKREDGTLGWSVQSPWSLSLPKDRPVPLPLSLADCVPSTVRPCVCSRMAPIETPWTAAHQAPLSMGFSRRECWSGLPFPSPGDLPDPGIELGSPALQADSLPTKLQGKPSKQADSGKCFEGEQQIPSPQTTSSHRLDEVCPQGQKLCPWPQAGPWQTNQPEQLHPRAAYGPESC